jgi:excisionase family DNA binding protein
MTASTSAPAPVQLLTPAEVAERLRCSENHVYRLIAKGALHAVDVSLPGARRPKSRVSEADLAAYVKAQA